MEEKLTNQNKYHYSKVLQIKMSTNKIYHHLLEDEMRDKILSGNLRRDKYNNSNVFNFLTLLKQNHTNIYSTTKY